MNKFIQKIKSFFIKQKRYIYYVDGEKFTTNKITTIPWFKHSSPNENTPAFEDLKTGHKHWCLEGHILHRLTGPVSILSDGTKTFYVNGKTYDNVQDWLKDHPNPDLYFDAIGMNETDRVLWFLQK
jgi:hypothetical protein